jgi:hypothetical protein
MAQDLVTSEPIDIPFRRVPNGSAKHIAAQNVAEFWSKPEARRVADKQGCYVFALRAGKGYRVWYVGKATKSFERECFASHKLNHYNDVLFDGRKGTPVLFIIAPDGNKTKVPAALCDDIETLLIHAAYIENPEIKNRQKTKIPTWTIAGVVRRKKGAVSKRAQVFRTMMGLD